MALAARAELSTALAVLNRLVDLQPTMERHSLCGSAYKRLAMIERVAGRPAHADAALRDMLRCYAAAECLGCDAGMSDWYYPAWNRLAGEIALQTSTARIKGKAAQVPLDDERWAAVRQMLVNKTRNDPDFFSVVGLTEVRMLEAIADGSLSQAGAGIASEFDALHARMPSTPKWKSVHDQLDFALAGVFAHGAPAERDAARTLLSHVEAYIDAGG